MWLIATSKSRRTEIEKVRRIAGSLTLKTHRVKMPAELSGGMRRRVGIAPSLATEVAIISTNRQPDSTTDGANNCELAINCRVGHFFNFCYARDEKHQGLSNEYAVVDENSAVDILKKKAKNFSLLTRKLLMAEGQNNLCRKDVKFHETVYLEICAWNGINRMEGVKRKN